MSLESDLNRIIAGPGTKADRARMLFALGCDRTDAVELLGMSYSQAHSLWSKEFANGSAAVSKRISRKNNGCRGSGAETSHAFASPHRLNFGPTQIRVVTQDSHEVRRDLDGVKCINCDQPITFSLKYLGFVHTFSKKEPTKLEDRYD